MLALKFVVLLMLLFQAECQNRLLSENDTCILKNNQVGTCIHIYQCLSAKTMLKKKIFPQTCGFVNKQPLVCCDDIPGSKLLKKCAQYHDYIKNTFFTVGVGGEPSLAKEFPHMAAIGYGDSNNIQYLCGGTLITEQHVLTAAHCLLSKEYGEAAYVRLGDLDIKDNSDDAEPQDFKILQSIPHPLYNPPSQYHDIAVITLDKPVRITDYVIPACLHLDYEFPKRLLRVTGWGLTEFGGEPSSHLIKVLLDFVDADACKKAFASVSKNRLANGIDDATQLCAGGFGKDSCEGDSGGPLQYKMDEFKEDAVVGVTSFGKSCGLSNSPGVYTRVSNYIEWIESIAFQ